MKHKKIYEHPQIIVVEIISGHQLLAGSRAQSGFEDPDQEEMN